jgi:outer membrane protein
MKRESLRLAVAGAAAAFCLQPPVAAAKEGDWLLRAGVGVVDPKSNNLTTPLGEIEVDSATSLTVEGTYMFLDHWGVELLAAYPFNHDIKLDTGEGTPKIASTDQLPPTLSLQYHLLPDGRFRPYVGVGLNYTTFFNVKEKGPLSDAGTSLKLDDSWGIAYQIGADYGINENWFVNAAVRWIDIDTKAKLEGGDLDVGNIGTVQIDPFVYQLQVGYRFGKPAPVMAAAAPVVAAAPPPPPPPPPPPAPKDSDGDGVVDTADQCPDTPKGDRVGPYGCSCDVTRQLQFKFNSAELTEADKASLDEMADKLNKLHFVAGTVAGYTDSVGTEAYNLKLSERRAKTVADYLQAKGVAPGRLKVEGFGKADPIADNKTAEGRAQNRRVVLKRTDCDAK